MGPCFNFSTKTTCKNTVGFIKKMVKGFFKYSELAGKRDRYCHIEVVKYHSYSGVLDCHLMWKRSLYLSPEHRSLPEVKSRNFTHDTEKKNQLRQEIVFHSLQNCNRQRIFTYSIIHNILHTSPLSGRVLVLSMVQADLQPFTDCI